MNIAIIGYGKMGHEIEKHAPELGCKVCAIIDNPNDWESKSDSLINSDVAIEFTTPDVVVENLKRLMNKGIPVVTGTTGWTSRLKEVEQYCAQSNGSVFYASNFSIGVNLFFALNRYLAKLMSQYPEYSIMLEETHHIQKLDAPSGTAVSMFQEIIELHPKYNAWKFISENPGKNEIAVAAHRIENVTGTHKLSYQSAIDSIKIEHVAHNREGFAKGALMAAKWLPGKKGVYTMNDLLKL